MRRVELLAPAGSYDAFLAAMEAGADAVYAGTSMYGARAYAQNFTQEEFLRAIDAAHLLGKKMYMTVNTLMKEEELVYLPAYLKPYYEAGLDAVIVQDIGAIAVLRSCYPKLPVHASTQMTITDAKGVLLMQKLGISQVVPARELSLQEIRSITDTTDAAIECFIHGAICYSYSGKCLFSSLIGGRSGNRGRCAQPCRLPYEVTENGRRIGQKEDLYVLSLKDMCTLEILPKLIEAGISSFKIEGRMKKPEYVAGVTGMYRKYIDYYYSLKDPKEYKVNPNDLKNLLELYTRGGNETGYYQQKNGRKMLTLQKPNYETGKDQIHQLTGQYSNLQTKMDVTAKITLKRNEPARLCLYASERCADVQGEFVSKAQNKPLQNEDIDKQVRKLGNTFFTLRELQIDCDQNVFMSVKALNELRRNAADALLNEYLKDYRRAPVIFSSPSKQEEENPAEDTQLSAYAETKEALGSLCRIDEIKRLYLSYADFVDIEEAVSTAVHSKKQVYLALPVIYRHYDQMKLNPLLECLRMDGVSGVLVQNYEWLYILQEQKYKGEIISNYYLYMMNRPAKEQLRKFGCTHFTMPLELNEKELWNMDRNQCEMVIYGYLPMMVTAQCINNTVKTCDHRNHTDLTLRDRYQKNLHVKNCCSECYNVIYNSVPLSLHKELAKLKGMHFESLRLIFTNEKAEEVTRIAKWYVEALKSDQNQSEPPLQEFTKGHFARGVE